MSSLAVNKNWPPVTEVRLPLYNGVEHRPHGVGVFRNVLIIVPEVKRKLLDSRQIVFILEQDTMISMRILK